MSRRSPVEESDTISRDSGNDVVSLPFGRADSRLPAIAFRRAAGSGLGLDAAWGGERIWRRLGLASPRPEQLGDFGDRVHEDDREHLERAHEDAASRRSGYSARYRAVPQANGDEEIWLREDAEPLLDSQGRVVAFEGLIHDLSGEIATQRGLETSLAESEERFRTLVENATDGIAELGPDGCFLYASPSIKELLGYEPEDLIGLSPFQIVHREDRELGRTGLGQAFANQARTRAQLRLQHRDGSWRWAEVTGRAFETASGEVRFGLIGHDTTASRSLHEDLERQRDAEHQISELARHFLDRSLDSSPEQLDEAIVAGVESAAAIADAGRAYLVAIEPEAPHEQHFYESHTPGSGIVAPVISQEQTRKLAWSFDIIRRGETLHIADVGALPDEAELEGQDLMARGVSSLLGIPVRSGTRLIGYLCFEREGPARGWSETEIDQLRLVARVFSSALRRKHAEEALHDSQRQLLQSQKMEAVGRMAGGVAHDFNNLLTVILGFSAALLDELPEGDSVREDISEIRQAAERAARLTSQLLTFGRPQRAAHRSVDLNETIEGIEELLGRMLDEHIRLELELTPDLPPITGDPTQLEQILLNLTVNARDAMPDGGRLRISTSMGSTDAGERRRLGVPHKGSLVLLQVRDAGCGMDDETLSHIFEPFYTTKLKGEGSGLGLSIVYNAVKQCGGGIDVESKPGDGTTFSVYLPAPEDGA